MRLRRKLCRFTVALAIFISGAISLGVAHTLLTRTAGVSGMPHGVPLLCSDPNVVSTASGDWSNPKIWSTLRVPNTNDRITISKNHTVIYDVVANTKLDCIEVQGLSLIHI